MVRLYISIKGVCWFGLGRILHGKPVQDNRRKNMGKGNALYDFQTVWNLHFERYLDKDIFAFVAKDEGIMVATALLLIIEKQRKDIHCIRNWGLKNIRHCMCL